MTQLGSNPLYYVAIVESAETALAKDPFDTLTRQVTANISGGHYFWDDGAQKLFESPANLDEALLALELRTVLETAVTNQLREVRRLSRLDEVNLDIFGLPMDFDLLLSSVTKLASRNVLYTLRTKIDMARITMSADKRSLSDFFETHFQLDSEEADKLCAMF